MNRKTPESRARRANLFGLLLGAVALFIWSPFVVGFFDCIVRVMVAYFAGACLWIAIEVIQDVE